MSNQSVHQAQQQKAVKVVHNWKNVEVIGELTVFNNKKKVKLLQISKYIRDVFFCQLTRWYVHAFTLCEKKMWLWVFDCSGPYSSTAFDINEEPERFVHMIAAYVMMSDEELGLDTFIEWDNGNWFITIMKDATDKKRRLQLKSIPIAHQQAIVCCGTSCFCAKTLSFEDLWYVIKFSWVSDKWRSKVDLLRLTHKRGVKRVTWLFSHHCIISIADMHEGLKFEKPYAFQNIMLSSFSFFSQSQSLLSQSIDQLDNLSITRESLKKQKYMNAEESPSKRSRFNSQNPDKVKRKNEVARIMKHSQIMSLYTHDDSLFDNHIFSCLMISPDGCAIQDFQSISELLKALHNAIKAHRSLYTKKKILHRDISKNNIIITDSKKTNGFTGMLINKDLAKKISSGLSGAQHQTGTMKFMTIEVLQQVAHTYWHDLKSFFYVLLWICTHRVWERGFGCRVTDQLKESMLSEWYTGSFKKIAQRKEHTMGVSEFKAICEEFSKALSSVKPLCREIRGILFSLLKNRVLFIAMPMNSSEKLYQFIIEVFDKAIADFAVKQKSE